MSQVTFKERIAHLERNIDQYNNRSISQLDQPPRSPFSEKIYR